MSAGGYCEAALGEEGKTGKRNQNDGHYKPFSWSRGRRDCKEECYVPTIILHFYQSSFPKPSWLLHSVHQLTSPHLTTTNLAPAT